MSKYSSIPTEVMFVMLTIVKENQDLLKQKLKEIVLEPRYRNKINYFLRKYTTFVMTDGEKEADLVRRFYARNRPLANLCMKLVLEDFDYEEMMKDVNPYGLDAMAVYFFRRAKKIVDDQEVPITRKKISIPL
jgi:hypothetical protein